MKSTPFARKPPASVPPSGDRTVKQPLQVEEAPRPALKPLQRPVHYAAPANEPVFAQPKEDAIQHEGYMRLVRLLPCAMCGIEGRTQFCHADEGKGMAIKSDCRLGWPGCGPRPGMPGCHYLVGTSGKLDREEKRNLEAMLGAQTRAKLLSLGLWPLDLPYLVIHK